jgi:hypothetical protein
MAAYATTLKKVRGTIADRWTRRRIRTIAQKVLIMIALVMIASLPVAIEMVRRAGYPVEYELPHLPPELPLPPHELPHLSHTIDNDAELSSPVFEGIEARVYEESETS